MSHGSFLQANHLHGLMMRELCAFKDIFISALGAITETCGMSIHWIVSSSHAHFTLVNN